MTTTRRGRRKPKLCKSNRKMVKEQTTKRKKQQVKEKEDEKLTNNNALGNIDGNMNNSVNDRCEKGHKSVTLSRELRTWAAGGNARLWEDEKRNVECKNRIMLGKR